jgi:hypothetical protein
LLLTIHKLCLLLWSLQNQLLLHLLSEEPRFIANVGALRLALLPPKDRPFWLLHDMLIEAPRRVLNSTSICLAAFQLARMQEFLIRGVTLVRVSHLLRALSVHILLYQLLGYSISLYVQIGNIEHSLFLLHVPSRCPASCIIRPKLPPLRHNVTFYAHATVASPFSLLALLTSSSIGLHDIVTFSHLSLLQLFYGILFDVLVQLFVPAFTSSLHC